MNEEEDERQEELEKKQIEEEEAMEEKEQKRKEKLKDKYKSKAYQYRNFPGTDLRKSHSPGPRSRPASLGSGKSRPISAES
jgi:hypothetical protein